MENATRGVLVWFFIDPGGGLVPVLGYRRSSDPFPSCADGGAYMGITDVLGVVDPGREGSAGAAMQRVKEVVR
jgi:hypothetical protein